MSLHAFLWIAAAVAFGLGAANVPAGINWLCLGLCLATLTQVL